MPVVDGIDLRSMLSRDGPMRPLMAVRTIEQAAAALEAAHTSGLVHSDVRPSNLFVVGGEFVYLTDFGVAAHTPTAGSTGADVVVDSWPYLAPERFSSRPAEARSDILPFPKISHAKPRRGEKCAKLVGIPPRSTPGSSRSRPAP